MASRSSLTFVLGVILHETLREMSDFKPSVCIKASGKFRLSSVEGAAECETEDKVRVGDLLGLVRIRFDDSRDIGVIP